MSYLIAHVNYPNPRNNSNRLLDYLENQLFVPEIIKLNGMSGFNNQYIESNGKY